MPPPPLSPLHLRQARTWLDQLQSASAPSAPAVHALLNLHATLAHQHCLLHLARQRNWHHAATALQRQLLRGVEQMQIHLQQARHQLQEPPVRFTLRDLYGELAQLHEELGLLPADDPDVLAVVTPPITLEDIYLGPFRIELRLSAVLNQPDASAFRVIALSPNHARNEPGVVHPHLRDDQLCVGEGACAIAAALRQGRYCDAFLAMFAVLQTYNPDSAYVSLEDWEGEPCSDCGCTITDSRRQFTCRQCNDLYCDDCIQFCDLCNEPACSGCLRTDPVSSHACCTNCIHTCSVCGRLVDDEQYESEGDCCLQCLRRDEEDEEEQENPDNTTDGSTSA